MAWLSGRQDGSPGDAQLAPRGFFLEIVEHQAVHRLPAENRLTVVLLSSLVVATLSIRLQRARADPRKQVHLHEHALPGSERYQRLARRDDR